MPIGRNPHFDASIAADAMTPLIPGAGPPPTSIARVSAMRWTHAVDRAGVVVTDEETALGPDGDAGRAPDARGAAGLEPGEEIGPLRRRVAPIHRLRGPVPVHRDEDDARRRRAASVLYVPRPVNRGEQSAAIALRKRIRSRLPIRIKRCADDRGICRKLDQRLDGFRARVSGPVDVVILLANRPAVVGVAGMRGNVVEELVRVPEGEVVLTCVADPDRSRCGIDC